MERKQAEEKPTIETVEGENEGEGEEGAEEEEDAGPPPTVEEAKRLLAEGEFDRAQDMFSRLLEDLAGRVGETDPSCAELYYLYGCALLGSAKKESIAFLSSKLQQKAKQKGSEPVDVDEEDDIADGNEADELQNLAWQVLEAARLIYSSDDSKALELAEVHMKLGELQEEGDNQREAIEEYERALALRSKVLPPDDRSLAEVHVNIAMVAALWNDAGRAAESYTSAASVLRARLARVEGEGGKGEEVNELKEILSDIEERVDTLSKLAREYADAETAPEPEQPPPEPEVSYEPLRGSSNGNGHVRDLGVFGRGKRAAPRAVPSSSSSSSSGSDQAAVGGKRKREEELLKQLEARFTAPDSDNASSGGEERPASAFGGDVKGKGKEKDEGTAKRSRVEPETGL